MNLLQPLKAKKIKVLFVLFFIHLNVSFAQYTVNGNASKDNCNCYTLTPNAASQSGSVWNINKISLTNPFDFNYTVFLGNSDAGADGIAFVLQPISTSIGSVGGGMGFAGISPSLAVSIDTYQNGDASDPSYDHIAFQKNGDIDHSTANNLAGPVQALSSSANIEDGAFHTFRVVWNPTTQNLDAYLDGNLRLSQTIDIINSIFAGDPMVYWGFTGSTGGAQNLQRFCTQNIAAVDMSVISSTTYCDTATIAFVDQSLSSSNVSNWNWNFGDGTSSTLQNPTHFYSQPGTYNASLYIIGNDGCSSDTIQIPIVINPNPSAHFYTVDVCLGATTSFLDQSTITSGNITNWQWDFGQGGTASIAAPSFTYTSDGSKSVKLIVTSDKGCTDTIIQTVVVNPLPVADFSSNTPTGCSPLCIDFKNTSTINSGSVSQYIWDLGNDISGDENPKSCYNNTDLTPKNYSVSFIAISDKGCRDTIVKTDYVTVYAQPNAQFTSSTQEVNVSNTEVTFTNTSTNAVSYTWDFGDNTPTTASTNATHSFPNTDYNTYTVTLTAKNQGGCTDTAQTTIKVLAPDPIYTIPNVFTPNEDGANDVFTLINSQYVKETNITILNRWGNVILEQQDSTVLWNGKANNTGQLCASGVYFYKLTVIGLNGKEFKNEGFIHLVHSK